MSTRKGDRGDTQTSPWVWTAADYQLLQIVITVTFDNTTKALTGATVHRDNNCKYTKIVFDVPSLAKARRLIAPVNGAGDKVITVSQMATAGLNVLDDVLAVQITAEP